MQSMLSGFFTSLMVRPSSDTSKLATESIDTGPLDQEQKSVLPVDTKTSTAENISKVDDSDHAPVTPSSIDSATISDFMHGLELEEYALAISKSVSSLKELHKLPDKNLSSLTHLAEMTNAHAEIFIQAIQERRLGSSTGMSGISFAPFIKKSA